MMVLSVVPRSKFPKSPIVSLVGEFLMRLGIFSVLIPEGREHGNQYVGLRHGQVYSIRIGNHGNVSCDAEVVVDGKPMGDYRLVPGQTWNLERPVHDPGKYTFFSADSAEGQAAGAGEVSRDLKGLLTVTFKPAKQVLRPMSALPPTYPYRTDMQLCSARRGAHDQSVGGYSSSEVLPRSLEEKTCGGLAPGVTGLTGTSDQRFTEVANLDYDLTKAVVISLRLVTEDVPAVRKLEPVSSLSNPVPPPVG